MAVRFLRILKESSYKDVDLRWERYPEGDHQWFLGYKVYSSYYKDGKEPIVVWYDESDKELSPVDDSICQQIRFIGGKIYKFKQALYNYKENGSSKDVQPAETPDDSDDPTTVEGASLIIKNAAEKYGFRVKNDPNCGYWTGYSSSGEACRKKRSPWDSLIVSVKKRLGADDKSWVRDTRYGRYSEDYESSISRYKSPYGYTLVIKEWTSRNEVHDKNSIWVEKS